MGANDNFDGNKLKDMRIYRGLNLTELADRVDIPKQTISQYENGSIKQPSFEVLCKLARELKVSTNYFFQRDKFNVNVGTTYFRALSTSNKKDREMQTNKIKKVASLYNFLSQYLDFPLLKIIKKDIDNSDDIENIALELRTFWGLGLEPIKNLVNVLESKRNSSIIF